MRHEGVRDEFYNDYLANESIVVQKEKYDVSTSSYVDDGAPVPMIGNNEIKKENMNKIT